MMVFVKEFKLPPPDKNEIRRYIGGYGDAVEKIMQECLAEYGAVAQEYCKVCFCTLPVCINESCIDFSLFAVKSTDLAKSLCGCSRAVVFAATVGMGIDRLITKYSSVAPSKALVFQGIGAERTEALCNAFCLSQADEGINLHSRFSPGYGDLPLELQSEIFRVLDCGRKIGLYLNGSLVMSPSKSVTAIMGIEEKHNRRNS